MSRARTLVGLVVAVALAGLLLAADDKKPGTDTKDPTPKVKGQLRAGWKKLGLSADQVQKIYHVQSDYRGKIEDLEQKILDLKQQQLAEEFKVLTDAQRARLKEIGEEKVTTPGTKTDPPKDTTPKDPTPKEPTPKDTPKDSPPKDKPQ